MRIDVKGTIVSSDEAWIYDWFGIENTSPKPIRDALARARGEPVDVYINSGGGDIFAGSEIYSELRAYKGPVALHVTGLAASAASVIACAGPSDISPTGMVMVHNVSGSAAGDYHTMDKHSDVLRKANETIAAAYVEKTGMTLDEALKLMDEETWLSAADAVKKGLIDKVSEPAVRLTAACCTVLPAEVITKMRNSVKPPEGAPADDLIKAKAKLKFYELKGRSLT